MANKMTQRDYFNEIIALAQANGRDDIVTFAEGRIEALNKKSENKKPTKNQAENEVLKDRIKAVLEGAEPMTVTDILKADAAFEGISNQRVSALLKQMKDAGEVVKSSDKKRSLFALAA